MLRVGTGTKHENQELTKYKSVRTEVEQNEAWFRSLHVGVGGGGGNHKSRFYLNERTANWIKSILDLD